MVGEYSSWSKLPKRKAAGLNRTLARAEFEETEYVYDGATVVTERSEIPNLMGISIIHEPPRGTVTIDLGKNLKDMDPAKYSAVTIRMSEEGFEAFAEAVATAWAALHPEQCVQRDTDGSETRVKRQGGAKPAGGLASPASPSKEEESD